MEKLDEAAKKEFSYGSERIEETILRNLLCNEEYYRKVTPHLSVDYFESPVDRTIYEEIHEFSTKYDKLPTQEVLRINLGQRNDLSEEIYKDAISRIAGFSQEGLTRTGLLTRRKSGVKIEQSTTPYYSRSRSQMEAIRNYQRMRSQVSYKSYQYRSTNT